MRINQRAARGQGAPATESRAKRCGRCQERPRRPRPAMTSNPRAARGQGSVTDRRPCEAMRWVSEATWQSRVVSSGRALVARLLADSGRQ